MKGQVREFGHLEKGNQPSLEDLLTMVILLTIYY